MSTIEEFRQAINTLETYVLARPEVTQLYLEILRAALVEDEESAEYWAGLVIGLDSRQLRGPSKVTPLNMAALRLARYINELVHG